MKTANKQREIALPNDQELRLLIPEIPHRLPWSRRLRAALATAGWLLRAPALSRTVAPGQPSLAEHEWRNREREWIT